MNEETARCTICRQPLGDDGRCQHCDSDTHVWTIQDWRPLLILALLIALGFSFTSLVVTSYNDAQRKLAGEYYSTGIRAMDAQHPAEAVDAFETALVYSRDNFQYRLKLTDALLASGATSEARAQLHAFWELHPGDALVNLKLARLEAQRHHVDEALRYYQNAIEGVWPEGTDPIPQRIGLRFESATYLIEQGRKDHAEEALVALAAVLPAVSPERDRLADLFLRNGDPGRALATYQTELSQNKNSSDAMIGAAKASFAGGNYALAHRYLDELKIAETPEVRELRIKLDRMEALDPFARNTSERIRTERTMAAFRIAIARLAGCGVPFAQVMNGSAPSSSAKDSEQWSGFARWAEQLSPMMSERKLRGRDDAIESTMRFAFQAEMAAQKDCGKLTLDDEALLLLARERMGGK